MFGQSNFAANAFDVLIQLGKVPKKRSSKPHLANNAIVASNSDHGASDNVNMNFDVKDIPIPMVNHEIRTNSGLEESIDDSMSQVTPQDRNGGERDGDVTTSANDAFQVKNTNMNKNTTDLNELQTAIGSTKS